MLVLQIIESIGSIILTNFPLPGANYTVFDYIFNHERFLFILQTIGIWEKYRYRIENMIQFLIYVISCAQKHV